jgi:hypothetical protein
MITCTRCGSDRGVVAEFPGNITLTASVSVPGEVEVRLLEVLEGIGVNPSPRISGWQLNYDANLLSNIQLSDVTEYICSACSTKGTVGDGTFKVVNRCRCGSIDDGLFICTRFSCIMCHACRDRFECEECNNSECFFHRDYHGNESPPESTRDSTRHRASRLRMTNATSEIPRTESGSIPPWGENTTNE